MSTTAVSASMVSLVPLTSSVCALPTSETFVLNLAFTSNPVTLRLDNYYRNVTAVEVRKLRIPRAERTFEAYRNTPFVLLASHPLWYTLATLTPEATNNFRTMVGIAPDALKTLIDANVGSGATFAPATLAPYRSFDLPDAFAAADAGVDGELNDLIDVAGGMLSGASAPDFVMTVGNELANGFFPYTCSSENYGRDDLVSYLNIARIGVQVMNTAIAMLLTSGQVEAFNAVGALNGIELLKGLTNFQSLQTLFSNAGGNTEFNQLLALFKNLKDNGMSFGQMAHELFNPDDPASASMTLSYLSMQGIDFFKAFRALGTLVTSMSENDSRAFVTSLVTGDVTYDALVAKITSVQLKTNAQVLNVPKLYAGFDIARGRYYLHADEFFAIVPSNAASVMGLRRDGVYLSKYSTARGRYEVYADFAPSLDGPKVAYVVNNDSSLYSAVNGEVECLASHYFEDPNSDGYPVFRRATQKQSLSTLQLGIVTDLSDPNNTAYANHGSEWNVELVLYGTRS